VYHDKLNNAPIDGLTFTDTTAERGATYYYVVRAIDTTGMESLDSNERVAAIPGDGK
jgi:fibronectin type 3 domain-containing protein